jgi:phage virion morphogenesis protein
MADADLEDLEHLVAGMLEKLTTGQRRELTRKISTDLRRSQSSRIGAQQNPDGSAYEPRKKPSTTTRSGRVSQRLIAKAEERAARGPMFQKLRQLRRMQRRSNADGAEVGYTQSILARIAQVHQDGLRDLVDRRKADSPEADYPARILLGFSDDDRAALLDKVMAHLQPD